MRLICGHCGTVNAAEDTFCRSCDGFLDWAAQVERELPPPAGGTTGTPPAASSGTSPPPSGSGAVTPAARPAAAPAAPLPAAPAAPLPAAPGPICPACGVDNSPARRLCRRCGAWLTARPPTPPVWRPWWSRVRQAASRVWSRPGYRGALSPVTRVFRVVVLLAVLAMAGVLVSPLRGQALLAAQDGLGHVTGSGRVPSQEVAVHGLRGALVPGTAAGYASDGVRATAWGVRWTGPSSTEPAPAPCGSGDGAAAGLKVTFAEPVDLREVGFENGLADTDPDAAAQSLPEVVDLVVAGGGCHRVHLDRTGALQRIRLPQASATEVLVLVVSVYPPEKAGALLAVSIGELTFWRR